jgi:hypothetical protein
MQNSMGKRQCTWGVQKAERFMVAYIPWSRVANFITGEQDYMTDVQTRFFKRPIGAGKGGKTVGKAPRHNSANSNFRYSAVPAFHVRICSSLYYHSLVIMSSGETVHNVPIAVGDRLARQVFLTFCLPFLRRYKCQYGYQDRFAEIVNVTPDMERGPRKYDIKGKNVPNGRGKSEPRLIRAKNGESKKRGCRCRFNVKYLYYLRDIAEIVYYSLRHANDDGLVVHGEVRQGDHARYATLISAEIRTWVVNCLLAGVPIAKIMSMHIEWALQMKSECIVPDRNRFLREWDVRNIASDLRKNIYERHPNDAESVRLWIQANPDQVFFYQEFGDVKIALPGELNGESMPFVIGIQNLFQFQMMLEHGHESVVSLDATFGTNQPKVRLPTFLEFPSLFAGSHYGFLSCSGTTGDSLAVSPGKSLAKVQGPM